MPAEATDDEEGFEPATRKKRKSKKGSNTAADSGGKAATPAVPAGAPTAAKSIAKPGATAPSKGDGNGKAAGKGPPATTPSKGDAGGKGPPGKGLPAGKPAGGQTAEQQQQLEGAITRVLDKLLPDKLALALAQHPQGPRPFPEPAAPSHEWPALPRAASCAVPPAWLGAPSEPAPVHEAWSQPPPAQWTPNPLLPAYVPGASVETPQAHRLMIPTQGASSADGLTCPICNKFIRGGSSALRAHQAASSTCRAMTGEAAFGGEPCEFCGKMLAANDHWARNQHAVFCPAQRQARPSSGLPPTRWRPQRSDQWQAQQWQQPTRWQQQRTWWY